MTPVETADAIADVLETFNEEGGDFRDVLAAIEQIIVEARKPPPPPPPTLESQLQRLEASRQHTNGLPVASSVVAGATRDALRPLIDVVEELARIIDTKNKE